MVNLTRIYTRTGDDGTTALGDFSRTTKNDPRLVAYADVDEANCAIGVVLAHAATGAATGAPPGTATSTPAGSPAGSGPDLDAAIVELLRQVQNDLFDVGADLCLPLRPTTESPESPESPASRESPESPESPEASPAPLRVTGEYVVRLEQACDRWNEGLPALRSFILPGGTAAAAHLHVARTVTRRAERAVWAAVAAHGSGDRGVNVLTATYLNRLSDLLFILCRRANPGGDVLWVPGGGP